MRKVLPVVVLCTAAILTTLLLNGCGSKTAAVKYNPNKTHLTSFLTLHNKFCEKKYSTSDLLRIELKNSPSLKLAKDFEDVYEVLISEVSFAVSPEDDGCTTDVMVQSGDEQLFSFEEINKALISNGYTETGDAVSRKDIGTDQSELMVIEKKYISPAGELTTLDFPLEKKDKYYMTLFTEKFTQANKESKEQVLKTLRMASR